MSLITISYQPYFEYVIDGLIENDGHTLTYMIGLDEIRDHLKEKYPDTIVHDHYEAWRGVDEVDFEGDDLNHFDYETIEKISPYMVQCLDMMQRMDNFDHFHFQERLRFFYKQLRYWDKVFQKYKPELIVFECPPHVPYEHIMYGLAKIRGIQTVIYMGSLINDRVITYESYEQSCTRLKKHYEELLESKAKVELSPKMQEFFDKQTTKDFDRTPAIHHASQKSVREINKFEFKVVTDIIKFAKELLLRPQEVFKRVKKVFEPVSYDYIYKLKNTPLEDCRRNRLTIWLQRYIGARKKRKHFRHYLSMTQDSIPEGPFFYCPLHYQPEMTSSPLGGFHNTQYIMLSQMSDALPEGYTLVVKEHVSQFNPEWFGEGSRTLSFYDEVRKLKNVKLLKVSISSQDILKRAKAVVTLTGTAGVEGILLNVPVISFGHPWYKDCRGVFAITNDKELRRVVNGIISGEIQLNLNEVKTYLYALEENSFEGFIGAPGPNGTEHNGLSHYKAIKEFLGDAIRPVAKRTAVSISSNGHDHDQNAERAKH